MNLTAILAELYGRLDLSSTPPAAVIARLTRHVNTTQRQILRTPGLDSQRDDTVTFASVSGQSLYGLPPALRRVESITDRTTQISLDLGTLSALRKSDPGLVQTGPSDTYVLRGLQQVAVQPAAATGLWAVSTSGSDVQNCFIETVRTGGYQNVGAAVVLTGITRKALGALVDHIEVTKFYVSSAAVGAISLYDAAAAGNELARIPIGATYARYQGIQLYPTPASAITYYVDYVRGIFDLVNGTDEPVLDEDFHDLLVEGALIKEWVKVDDSRRVDAERTYKQGMSALKYFANCPPDLLPSRPRGREPRSRLGAYYGPTRY